MTCGEQPTVFSLKSRRSLPARPPVGGEYGAMRSTARRTLGIAHLDAAGVRFESFSAGQRRDGGEPGLQAITREFLDRDDLDEVGGRKTRANSRRTGRGQHVIGPEA
jgi:hypothetical protein